MAHVKNEKLHNYLIKKREFFNIKVGTRLVGSELSSRIQGELKNRFIDDCIKRNTNEAKLLRHIIDIYYSLIPENSTYSDKEPNEIKKYIINNIKL